VAWDLGAAELRPATSISPGSWETRKPAHTRSVYVQTLFGTWIAFCRAQPVHGAEKCKESVVGGSELQRRSSPASARPLNDSRGHNIDDADAPNGSKLLHIAPVLLHCAEKCKESVVGGSVVNRREPRRSSLR
jgi:hypothetical protein